MKRKLMIKRIISLLLTVALTGTLVNGFVDSGKENLIYGAEETIIFAEGFGTGTDFDDSNGSWNITTTWDPNADSSYTSDTNGTYTAKIVKNNYSKETDEAKKEPIIRLIDGVDDSDLSGGASDYRIGTAISTQKIKLKDSKFSAKFTISMPDAYVNSAQTGGTEYAREVGGDGIAFIITTNDSIVGKAGGGIGYDGVGDSIIVELDSYFNGAYCTFAESSTAYTNWDYDNQIYANSNYEYLEEVANADYTTYPSDYAYGAFWDQVLNPEGYAQLSGSSTRRYDHVGVMLNGDPKNHLGISYLNDVDPSYVDETAGVYSNLADSTKMANASTASTDSNCADRFADSGVNDRLFTFWIEYDGTNMHVSYANGDFVNAVRPATPQITIDGTVEGNEGIVNKFSAAENGVNIGFTSAVGSSKANHTVHSVMFVNDYMENGISTTSYTSKYYIESPEAESNYITVNNKKYVCNESLANSPVALGSSATITDKANTDAYKNYELVDYSSLTDDEGDLKYPKTVSCVDADGSTVLYQFYDLKPTYTVEYYLEVDEGTEGAIEKNNKWFVLKDSVVNSESTGTLISVTYNNTDLTNGYYWAGMKDSTIISNTKKRYEYYMPDYDTTINANAYQGTVSSDTSLVLECYYSRIITEYTEKYYLKDDTATTDYIELTIDNETHKYKLQSKLTNVVKDVKAGSEKSINDLSNSTNFTEYSLLPDQTANGYPSKSIVAEDGSTVLYQFYGDVKKTTYKGEYYLELEDQTQTGTDIITINVDGKDVKFKKDTNASYESEEVANNSSATIDDKKNDYPKYDLVSVEGYPSTVSDIDNEGNSVVYQIYRLKPSYTVNYYLEASSDTEGAVLKNDKYYILQSESTFTKNVAHNTVVGANEINNEAGVVEGDNNNPVNDSYKSFENYEYNVEATNNNGKDSITVVRDGENVVELLYNKKLIKYTEKYLVEIDDQTSNDYNEIIGGIKYKVKEQVEVTDVPFDSKAVITDKSNDTEYIDYTPIASPDNYPSEVTDINDDGTTIVYQIFNKKPVTEYKEYYYVEDPSATSDYIEIEINGEIKKFVLKEKNHIDNVEIGSSATVTDKSMNYEDYELVTVTLPGYPTSVEEIDSAGGTILYQIYVLKNKTDVEETTEEEITEEVTTEEETTEEETAEEETTKEQEVLKDEIDTGDRLDIKLYVILLCMCIVTIMMLPVLKRINME